jgi:xanthine dehydrogenase YagT iron-sulfur-binding subunit
VGPIQTPDGLMMIDLLHEYVGLTGSRLGCGQGVCHACVVILDKPDGTSEEVRTCITGAHFFDGKKVRTIEGHAKRNEQGEVVASRRCSRNSSNTSAFSAATARRDSSMRRRC